MVLTYEGAAGLRRAGAGCVSQSIAGWLLSGVLHVCCVHNGSDLNRVRRPLLRAGDEVLLLPVTP